MVVVSQRQRVTDNEAVFRNWNEQVHGRDETQERGGSARFICECSDENCGENIKMKNSDYGVIHERRDQFIVVPGHEFADVERVVQRHMDYYVVRKKAQPNQDAATLYETDVENV